MSDREILRLIPGEQASEALAELVRRYGGLVYRFALRQVRDPHLAEDVMQAVFIVLVQKAQSIRSEVVFSSWLFTVTRHAASNARRMEARRRRHETKKAAMMQDAYEPIESIDQAAQSLIFMAISKLSIADQSAVVLRYFQGQAIGEVARALAISEEAARKRLSRALDKLHEFLQSHGITNAQQALALCLTPGLSIPVPQAVVAKSVVNVALLSHSTASQNAAARTIANRVSRMITFTHQLKLAGMAAAALLVVAVTAGPLLKKNASTAPTTAPTVATVPASQDTSGEFTAVVSNDISIHILGVSPFNSDENSWFAADGNPIQPPQADRPMADFRMDPPPTHQMLLKIDKPQEVTVRSNIVDAEFGSGFSWANNSAPIVVRPKPGDKAIVSVRSHVVGTNIPGGGRISLMGDSNMVTFTPKSGDKTATLRVLIADGDWQTIVTDEKPQEAGDFKAEGYGTFSFQPVTEQEIQSAALGQAIDGGKSPTVVFTCPFMLPMPMKVVVIDDANQQHETAGNSMMSNGQTVQVTDRVTDVPLAKIKKVLVMVRPFTKVVEISDISLISGQITKPQVKIGDAPPSAANLGPSGL